MLRDEQLAEILLKNLLLSRKELRNAKERQLNVENESLEESLLFLGLADYQKLGQAYALHYKLPYYPVFHRGIAPGARERFPLRTVQRLNFLPVKASSEGALGVVTWQPDDESCRQRLGQLAGGKIEWRVASRTEIRDAIQVHYLDRKINREKRSIELPFDFKIIDVSLDEAEEQPPGTAPEMTGNTADPEKKRVILIEPDHRIRNSITTLLTHEGYRVAAVIDSDDAGQELLREDAVYILQRRTYHARSRRLEHFLKEHKLRAEIRYFGSLGGIMLGEELSPEELFRNYLDTVKLLVGALTRQTPAIIRSCHLMAHYGRLLATSLGLKRKSQEGLLLAIYLKEIGPYTETNRQNQENNILSLIPVLPYEKSAAVLKEIEDSFKLAEIIDQINKSDRQERLEARIITLLLWLLDEFGEDDGGIREISAEDFYQSLDRENSRQIDRQLAEELFQIISHEQHLTGRGRSSGTILVLDPSFERDQHDLHTRLIRESYEITIASQADQALALLQQQPVLLVISEIVHDRYDGIDFCQTVKQKFLDLPFVFFSTENREAVISRALLAGADDFIPKESSTQVAFLKINRFIQQGRRFIRPDREGGVSGSLEEMGFMETIQILANREKDALISLRDIRNQEAEVYLHQGEIIHARCAGLEGENAIYELLTWKEGFFQVRTPKKLPERNVFGSTEAIMLEGCRLMDESQRDGGDVLSLGK